MAAEFYEIPDGDKGDSMKIKVMYRAQCLAAALGY